MSESKDSKQEAGGLNSTVNMSNFHKLDSDRKQTNKFEKNRVLKEEFSDLHEFLEQNNSLVLENSTSKFAFVTRKKISDLKVGFKL